MNMKSLKKSALASAVLLGMGLGAAGNAQANATAYGYSFDNIDQLHVQGFDPVAPGSGLGPVHPFFINNFGSNSHDSASIQPPGSGPSHSDNGSIGHRPDAAPAFTPATPALGQGNNYWAPAAGGPDATASWNRGDAATPLQNVSGDTHTQAINVAESNSNPSFSGTGQGDNSSNTSFDFTVNTPFALRFDFTADPYMRAFIDSSALPFVSQAQTTLSVSFTIVKLTGPGTGTVFNWVPDGTGSAAGSAVGGVTADPFSLNTTLNANPGDDLIYDPSGLGAPTGGTGALVAPTGFFAAHTLVLSGGQYRLSLTSTAVANTTSAVAVPEPATLGLMGLGLSILTVGKMRRKLGAKA